jgi:hypothetical protein
MTTRVRKRRCFLVHILENKVREERERDKGRAEGMSSSCLFEFEKRLEHVEGWH